MMRRYVSLLVLCFFSCVARAAIPLGGSEHFQYVVFDAPSRRVFVAHGNEVTVVDAAALRVVGHVTGLSGAHGIALVPGGHGYADSGRARTVTVFDPVTYLSLATLKADDDAYAVIYDPASRHVFVMNDDAGNITIIDPATDRVAGTLQTGPGLESAEADGAGHLFIAHSEARQVLRIDTRRNRVDAAWSVAACGEPHGLALDAAHRRVFVSCPAGRLLELDSTNGQMEASLPIGTGGDCLIFDAARHRLYSPNAVGTLSVLDTAGATLRALPDIPTQPGARTGALDPQTGRIFLVTAELAGETAPKKPGGLPKYRFRPGSAQLLVIDPSAQP